MSEAFKAIRKAARVLFEEGQTVELRALGVPTGGDWTATFSGYFNNFAALAGAAVDLDRRGAKGTYVTLNPARPDLLARCKNKVKRCRKHDPLTKNEEIERRRWLPFDFDPVRPAGISSTDEELRAARARAIEAAHYLKGKGWPGGLLAESGNGAHLLYRVDLPADDKGLCKRVLKALAEKFFGEGVELDTGVHNAARIWKLYGTTARKGDETKERPHRRARILRVAEELRPVPAGKLQALAIKPTNGHETASKSEGDLPVEEVEKALSCIPARPDYETWYRIAVAVEDALGGSTDTAVSLLKAWSPEEEPGEYRMKLESGFKEITAGTLIHEAEKHGYKPPWKRSRASQSVRANGQERSKASGAAERSREEEAEASPEIGILASDVERETVRWLWEGRLALGEMTILDGDPGLGKSTLLCDLSARITTGRPLPGDEDLVPAASEAAGGVVIVTGEDSIAHTIRPRLEAAGAELTRCRIVQHVPDENENPRAAVIPKDLDKLRRAVESVEARLLVIDPLMAHLPGELNAHRDQDVRAALTPLAGFAREAECAVVVVRHLNKMQGASALYRGGGSIGIIGAFRIGLLMGEDPEAEGRLVLASNKNNLAPKPPSLGLRLEGSPDVEGVACVRWEGRVSYSASDLLQSKGKGRQSPETDRAEAFLKDFLAEGPRLSADVYEEAEEEGIAKKTLKRAKKRLGIESKRIKPGCRRWYFVPPWAGKDPAVKGATKENGPLTNGLLNSEEKPRSEVLNGDWEEGEGGSTVKGANSERNGPLNSQGRDSASTFKNNGSSAAASENDASAKIHRLGRVHASGKSGGAFPFEKKQPVKTPKGPGTVVKVEGRTVYVELEDARIGETEAFDVEDVEPLGTPF